MSAGIVVLGSVNIDLVVSGPALPRPGETVTGGKFLKAHGGKGANQAVAAQRLRGNGLPPVTFVGALGADAFGSEMLDALGSEGIDLSHAQVAAGLATGVALIMVANDGSGENQISVAPGANAAVGRGMIEALPPGLFQSASVFLVSLEVPLEAVRCGLARARDAGATTILNPAPVSPGSADGVLGLLPLVDVLVPNALEAEILRAAAATGATARPSPLEMGRVLLDMGPRAVILTLGGSGCLVCERGDGGMDASAIPAQAAAKVVDTTGAGDCFCGALAAELVSGLSLADACRFASAAAGICVTRAGAQASMPFRAELASVVAG